MICFFIYKQDCKPGYVFQMIIYLEQLLPAASSNLPKTNGPHYRLASVLLQMGFTCAPSVTREAVVSYTALPPLPVARRYISVALSLELPPPAVSRHPALWSPDFPRLRSFDTYSRDHPSYLYMIESFPIVTFFYTSSSIFIHSSLYCLYTSIQLPPMNSLSSELLGISSAGTGRK